MLPTFAEIAEHIRHATADYARGKTESALLDVLVVDVDPYGGEDAWMISFAIVADDLLDPLASALRSVCVTHPRARAF